MAFRGVTFSGQNVSPKNDGALYNAHYGDGILEGCSMAISGDDLVIQSGHIIACGRVCQVDGATPVDLSGRTLQTGYIQVVLNYDISQGEGQQWFPTFVESATTTFPALTKEDINTPSGTLYQLELAVVQISGGNLTNIISRMRFSNVVVRNDSNEGGIAHARGNQNIFLFSDGGDIYIRPNGETNSANQSRFDAGGGVTIPDGIVAGGNVSAGGGISAGGDIVIDTAGVPHLYLRNSGSNKGDVHYDIVNNLVQLINSIGNTRLNLYDNGDIFLNGGGGNVAIRPNGTNAGQVIFGADGQQIGGHPLQSNDGGNNTKSIPASSSAYTNLASLSGLDASGIYLIIGKTTFTPDNNTASTVTACLSDTLTSNNLGWAQSVGVSSTSQRSICVPMLITGITTIRLNLISVSVTGTASRWFLRAIRLS